jgi:anti-sigma B factor antagonist
MYTSGPVIVMQLPEQLKRAEARAFCNELQPFLEADHPRVVLDGSLVQDVDSAGIEMLLHCMEQTMKRDGDLKLAAVSPVLAVILELVRVDRLFEIFETAEEAVQSFQAYPVHTMPHSEPWYAAAYGPLGDLKAAS